MANVPIRTENTPGTYSSKVAYIYVFNLVVGAGALALPQAFALTGWILGLVTLGILAVMSFITTTFMVEAMAIANAVHAVRISKAGKTVRPQVIQRDRNSVSSEESTSGPAEDTHLLINSSRSGTTQESYEITKKFEMGQMAQLFYNRIGIVLYYLVISLYLYGDLAIYAAAVPKSLTRVTCNDLKSLHNRTQKSVKQAPCFQNLATENVYRIYLLLFTLLLGPFVFFNIQKTKYLQLLTSVTRWLAFILMIILALVKIAKGEGYKHATVVNFEGLPNFFGVSVYSFMCQHSLPSILTPVGNKSNLTRVLAGDFMTVLLFYVLVLMTSVFTFSAAEIQDLYTLNFVHAWPGFAYFLALFPVFTLSSSFPIIGITLRENLKSMILKEGRSYSFFVEHIAFPLVTVVPPVLIALATTNVEELVNVTGSYAGTFIQYVIPVTLVYCGRKKARRYFGLYTNKHRSIFRQKSWIFFVVFWAGACIALVTAYNIKRLVSSVAK